MKATLEEGNTISNVGVFRPTKTPLTWLTDEIFQFDKTSEEVSDEVKGRKGKSLEGIYTPPVLRQIKLCM